MKTEFEKAFDAMPDYITGYDPFYHKTAEDLGWLVLLQCDLYEEGEESDIRTQSMYRRCLGFVNKYARSAGSH